MCSCIKDKYNTLAMDGHAKTSMVHRIAHQSDLARPKSFQQLSNLSVNINHFQLITSSMLYQT
jgi:hypothetical protein